MKNLIFAIALAPVILSLAGCGKQTPKSETEYTVTVDVEGQERVSGVMQDSSWADDEK